MKNVFLHGELEKEININLPLGFNMHLKGKKVCKLKKALYGLKQSPQAWFRRFAKVMITVGYKQRHSDYTLFVKHLASGGVAAIPVYIDDIIVTKNDLKEREALKVVLRKRV